MSLQRGLILLSGREKLFRSESFRCCRSTNLLQDTLFSLLLLWQDWCFDSSEMSGRINTRDLYSSGIMTRLEVLLELRVQPKVCANLHSESYDGRPVFSQGHKDLWESKRYYFPRNMIDE